MQITWTNCSEQMPPDDEIIVQYMEDKPKLFDGSRITESLYMSSPEIVSKIRWTPYTEEKLKELK